MSLLPRPGSCPPIGPPTNGHALIVPAGDIVRYVCSHGYILRGSPARNCVDGEWTGTMPECVGKAENALLV